MAYHTVTLTLLIILGEILLLLKSSDFIQHDLTSVFHSIDEQFDDYKHEVKKKFQLCLSSVLVIRFGLLKVMFKAISS